ncbi:class III extradiol dioxygenase subunit B-like domain-containing protein [Streptomyces calidiresistens]|uniref:class III extradiol dioxygenase subunit B-like domain-containing protein n=1 Tax=Streptomyces calidiresistens TaxID=1485586 RepID=UPI001E3C981B|nr:class III extradiol dioxygenase subunit B-like domain-containing protein [Streptomyces calidiresistens]
MLVAAAVCPCPPLLVPALAAGAARETEELREACRTALRRLLAADADRLVVVGPADRPIGAGAPVGDGGPAPGPRVLPAGTPGSFAGFGVPLEVTLGSPERSAAPGHDDAPGADGGAAPSVVGLPLAHAVAAFLLGEVTADAGDDPALPPVSGLVLPPDLSPERCLETGRELAADPTVGRVALLVMGDGSACRGPRAPGWHDDRAEEFDAGVSAALAAVDTSALAALDPALAEELRAVGRPGWQVLAGAAGPGNGTPCGGLRGELLHDGAPYGVAYPVALWHCEEERPTGPADPDGSARLIG